jgi:hypothetical protein
MPDGGNNEQSGFRPQLSVEPQGNKGETEVKLPFAPFKEFLAGKGKTPDGLSPQEANQLLTEFRQRPDVKAFEEKSGFQLAYTIPASGEPGFSPMTFDMFLHSRGKSRAGLSPEEATTLLNEYRQENRPVQSPDAKALRHPCISRCPDQFPAP